MRSNRSSMLCCEPGNTPELSDAGVAHLRLKNRDRSCCETIAHFVLRIPFLARGDRHRTVAYDAGQSCNVLGLHGRLDERGSIRFERGDQLERLGGGELPMKVDHDL